MESPAFTSHADGTEANLDVIDRDFRTQYARQCQGDLAVHLTLHREIL